MDPLQNPTKLKTTKPTAVFFKLFHTIQKELHQTHFVKLALPYQKIRTCMHTNAEKQRDRDKDRERQRQKDTERL